MPRPNKARSIASEANLRRRIAHERDVRGLSYEALAQAMTDRGCAIPGSALFKIEKGDPPRRVTVDELVALAGVFDVTIDELLKPMEFIEKERAEALIVELNETLDELASLIFRIYAAYLRCIALEIENPELAEYVDRKHDFYVSRIERGVAGDVDTETRRWLEEDFRDALLPLAQAFMRGLVTVAQHRAKIAYGWSEAEEAEKVNADG